MNRALFGLLAAAGLAALSGCMRQKPPAAAPALKVTVSHPQSMMVTNWDEYPGHIEAVEMVELRPRVSGYLDSIHFEDGAEVKAGDLLFVIDPRPYQAELDRAAAARRQADTHLQWAKDHYRPRQLMILAVTRRRKCEYAFVGHWPHCERAAA